MTERAQLAVVVGCCRRRVGAVAGENVRGVGERTHPQLVDRALRVREVGLATGAPARARTGRARRPEDGIGFVDQREVGVGPLHRGEVGAALAEQERLLVVGEHPTRRRAHEGGEPEEVAHEFGAAEDRPHAVERGAHVGDPAHARGELLLPLRRGRFTAGEAGRDGGVGHRGRGAVGGQLELLRLGVETGPVGAVRAHERAPVLALEVLEQEGGDVGAPFVVRTAARVCALDDAGGVAPTHAEDVAVEADDHVARHRALAVADGGRDHLRHAHVALDRGGGLRLGAAHLQSRLQRRRRRQAHFVLAQRRQDLVDVAQEDRARTDEQHALRREALAVRVEEVGGAVQRDGGLAGAGTARDDEDPGDVGADGFVLLGLDGGDDVAHAAGAFLVEGGEQRTLPHHGEARGLGGVGVEHLVVEADDLPAVGLEVAAAGDAHRLDGRGPVEGLGEGRAPVDDQRREVVVGDRDATDVERLGGLGGPAVGGIGGSVGVEEVEAAEGERRVADVEAGQAAAGVGLGGLALEPGLVGAASSDLGVALGHPFGRPTHDVEPGVRDVEMALLGLQLGGRAFGFEIGLGAAGGCRRARCCRVGQQTMLRIQGTGQFTP